MSYIYYKYNTHYITVGNTLINVKVLSAFIICSILILAGAVRVLSYSRGSFIAPVIDDSLLRFFAYQPENYFSVNFFKIIATPAITALIYFLFRGFNDRYEVDGQHRITNEWRRVDFNSRIFRFWLIFMITLCWIPVEFIKFHFKSEFYPYSTLENPLINSIVLTVGGILCFFLMKYLPFKPLITKRK